MSETVEQTTTPEPTPSIAQLFDAFCQQHGVVPVVVSPGRVTGTPIPVVDLMEIRANVQIQFVLRQAQQPAG